MDFARSSSPAVQRQLDRLMARGPGADVLGLDRITRLLARLGNPHEALPPVFHAAGTNGKGSTCAFLRTALEAAGHAVHVFTSPHLVRFNERIRIAGRLIEDAELAPLLQEVLDRGGDIGASFFEVTTAAAFLAFSRAPADACVIEVGLGGRLDATNVLPDPVACGIAQLGLDHQAFLGDTLLQIAREKAGIAKRGSPLVTLSYPAEVNDAIAYQAEAAGAPLYRAERDWHFEAAGGKLHYRDASDSLTLPLPDMVGVHQHANLALALAMMRHQSAVRTPPRAFAEAAVKTRWPARMQRLGDGPLRRLLPPEADLWLDGGHNAAAAEAVRDALAQVAYGRPVHLVLGMLANKDAAGLLAPFAPYAASLTAVPVPGHECHSPQALAGIALSLGIPRVEAAENVPAAVRAIAAAPGERPAVLILGSLYLAGAVLEENGEVPD